MNEETRSKLGIKEDQPNDWFETLYSKTNTTGNGVPWANMVPHPIFKNWIDKTLPIKSHTTALVVGCGLGDDAIELANKGYKVTAFDVSQSAIELCKIRFPNSNVEFIKADLIKGIPKWHKKFDLVLEIFTIQALPPKYEKILIKNISDFVADNGKLIIITETQIKKRTYKIGPPWILNIDYIESFEENGLKKTYNKIYTETKNGDEIHLSVFNK